jgi:tetratricopeptide (TPR) repeat protein
MTAMTTSTRSRCEALLVKLHGEMRAGRGEEHRAEELRSEMAALWSDLTDDEATCFDEISEDLYFIEGQRVVVPLEDGETAETVLLELAKAFKAQEDRRALGLTRKLPSVDARTAYVIARCWERLGFPRAAVCFYDFANELEPKAWYEAAALEALVRAGGLDEAAERAEAIEKRAVVSGTLLLAIASVLQRAAASGDEHQRHSIYQRVVQMVEAAWDDSTALASARAMGLLAAGFSYQHLGKPDLALQSFERAVGVHPSEGPLLSRGLALLHIDRPRALRDITSAVKVGTKFDWPYLYAVLHALEAGRLAEAERFCEAGVDVAKSPEVRGRLFEWWAIAAAGLGRTPEEVTALFDKATAELPLDLVIRNNVHRYLVSLKIERVLTANDWELDRQIDEAKAWASFAPAA